MSVTEERAREFREVAKRKPQAEGKPRGEKKSHGPETGEEVGKGSRDSSRDSSYKSIYPFSVETAGHFDRDAELKLWRELTELAKELREAARE